ncbi:MAG: T3SS (YopN, CesT) and YbjN peptide-binding chaperone 1 [Actinomycetales bacterium]
MTSPTSLPDFSAPTPSRLDQVMAVLTQLGVNPEIDSEGDVSIRVNDQQLYVRVSDDGPGIVRVFGQWQILDDISADPGVRFGAAHHVTATHALVKVNIFNDTLAVAVDNLAPEGARFDVLLSNSIDAVLSGVSTWHRLIVESSAPTTGDGDAPAEGSPGSGQ